MNDLSNSSDSQGTQTQGASSLHAQMAPAVPSGAKETEPSGVSVKEGLHDATGQEINVPKEVISAS